MTETFLDRIATLERNVTTIMTMLGLDQKRKPGRPAKTPSGSTARPAQGKARLKRGEAPRLIMGVLKRPMTVADIHQALGPKDFHDNTLRASLSTMAKSGTVVRDKKTGTWTKAKPQ